MKEPAPWVTAASAGPASRFEHLVRPGGLMVLAAHPDDESLGCGQLIREAHLRGRDVVVVLVTDGAASHPQSRRFPPPYLARLRWLELRRALDVLAPGGALLWALDLPDGLAHTRTADLDAAAVHLAERARGWGIGTILTTCRADPHVDHATTFDLAARVTKNVPGARLLSYPIWSRCIDEPPAPLERIRVFGDGRHGEAKRRAVAAHQSQMTGLLDDDPDGFVMPKALQTHFVETPELFVVEAVP